MAERELESKYLSWNHLRWSYMPARCRAYQGHYTLRRLGEFFVCALPLYVLHSWKAGRAIQWDSSVEWAACLLFAVSIHLFFGLMALPIIGLRYAIPSHAASVSDLLGLEVRFRYGIEDADFDRARLVIFSPEIIRLRAYAGEKSVTAGVPPDLDLDLLVELLPGEVQVWDARSRKRLAIASPPQPQPNHRPV